MQPDTVLADVGYCDEAEVVVGGAVRLNQERAGLPALQPAWTGEGAWEWDLVCLALNAKRLQPLMAP